MALGKSLGWLPFPADMLFEYELLRLQSNPPEAFRLRRRPTRSPQGRLALWNDSIRYFLEASDGVEPGASGFASTGSTSEAALTSFKYLITANLLFCF